MYHKGVMFKRKNPLTFLQKLRQTLWPRMGWLRVLKFYRARIVRLASPTRTIAANLAAGAAMSFTPFFGIHIFGAMAIAWLLGAGVNVIAAVVGTFVGNPWTFPFLLYSSNRVGGWVLQKTGLMDRIMHVDPDFVEKHGDGLWAFLTQNFYDVFVPTAVGGTLLAILSYPVYYYVFYYTVRGAQRARRLRMKLKQRKTFNKSAAPRELRK